MKPRSDHARPPEIVDSHCHLDFPDFDGELPEVIARAQAAGVTPHGHDLHPAATRTHASARLPKAYPAVFYAAGTHPMSAAEEPLATVDELVALAQHPKFVGIGETGLDYHYTADSKAMQQTACASTSQAAQETGLPLIIHARDADDDMAAHPDRGIPRQRPTLASCTAFPPAPALAAAALDLGFYLSMSGIAAFPKSGELRDIFAAAPLDRILLETDSPYLAPPPYRGRRNEPAYTAYTARTGAELFGLTDADFAAATTANFDRLFAKAALAS